MIKTVDILGTKYRIYLNVNPERDKSLNDVFGYCIPSERCIKVVDMDKLANWNDNTAEARLKQHKENVRHEIIHAFLHESGLWSSSMQYSSSWAMNEEMVDWIAIQYPKIRKVFQILDCED